MQKYKAVRGAAEEQMIERLTQYDEMTGDAFVQWLIAQRWTKEEALQEYRRIVRARMLGRSGQFRIYVSG